MVFYTKKNLKCPNKNATNTYNITVLKQTIHYKKKGNNEQTCRYNTSVYFRNAKGG